MKKKIECDFVINKSDLKYYIQSSYRIDNLEKKEQEIRPLLNTNDSFKKIIITRDNITKKRDDYGIITISLKEFLLNENSLEG